MFVFDINFYTAGLFNVMGQKEEVNICLALQQYAECNLKKAKENSLS